MAEIFTGLEQEVLAERITPTRAAERVLQAFGTGASGARDPDA